MQLNLAGKVGMITGASGGLGAAIAVALAAEGMRLILIGRDQQRLEAAAARCATTALCHTADLAVPDTAQRCVIAALEVAGRLDLLVNCAGATKRGDFFDLTDENWADGFALKFFGTVRMCRAAWPHLAATDGSIVNIVGVGSRTPSADFLIGGSVNSALLNFTKGLAERGLTDGVRVNAVNPGIFSTERTERRMRESVAQGLSREDAEAALLASTQVTRLGRPHELGSLVAFLASEHAAYLHGATLDIDGGASRGL